MLYSWGLLYLTVISLFFAGILTAYANIFGTSFATYVPLWGGTCDYSESDLSVDCELKYRLVVLVYFAVMVYFTVIEFHEQTWMQVTMTVVRVAVILLIAGTCLVSLALGRNLTNAEEFKGGHPPMANVGMLGETLPVLLFSGLYQTIFPSVIQSIRKEVSTFLWIVTMVTLSLMVFYSFIGMAAAFEINDIPSNVSLAFLNFTFGASRDHHSWWTYAVEHFIVLFPALDVISIFPIVAHAVSDNIVSAVYGTNRRQILTDHKFAFYCIRVLAIVPSFIYALTQTHLVSASQGNIISNSGLLSFFLTLIMIPLCHIASRYFIPVTSLYEAKFSPNVRPTQLVSFLISLLSIPLFALNLYTVIV